MALFEMIKQLPIGTTPCIIKDARFNYKEGSSTVGYLQLRVTDKAGSTYKIGTGINLENEVACDTINELFISPLFAVLGINAVDSLPELVETINANVTKKLPVNVTCSKYSVDSKDSDGNLVHKEGFNYSLN